MVEREEHRLRPLQRLAARGAAEAPRRRRGGRRPAVDRDLAAALAQRRLDGFGQAAALRAGSSTTRSRTTSTVPSHARPAAAAADRQPRRPRGRAKPRRVSPAHSSAAAGRPAAAAGSDERARARVALEQRIDDRARSGWRASPPQSGQCTRPILRRAGAGSRRPRWRCRRWSARCGPGSSARGRRRAGRSRCGRRRGDRRDRGTSGRTCSATRCTATAPRRRGCRRPGRTCRSRRRR